MRGLKTSLLILVLGPIITCSALQIIDPVHFGGRRTPEGAEFDVVAVLGMSFFGLLTIPLWPTLILSILVTPVVMASISQKPRFREFQPGLLIIVSIVAGAAVGDIVLFPVIALDSAEKPS